MESRIMMFMKKSEQKLYKEINDFAKGSNLRIVSVLKFEQFDEYHIAHVLFETWSQ